MAVEQGGLDAAPAPLLIARHVGDHGMGVELGIEIAARDMAEGCRDHVGRLDPRAFPRGRIPAAGLQEVPLDPVQRRPHRLVMGMHHAAVAMGITPGRQQGRQRHRFGRREGDVETRAVLMGAVALAAKADAGADHVARQQRLELAGRDMKVGPQSQGQRAPAVPEAAVAVFRVLRPPGVAVRLARCVVAAVAAQVVGRGRRGCQVADRRNHGSLSWHGDWQHAMSGGGSTIMHLITRRERNTVAECKGIFSLCWVPLCSLDWSKGQNRCGPTNHHGYGGASRLSAS